MMMMRGRGKERKILHLGNWLQKKIFFEDFDVD